MRRSFTLHAVIVFLAVLMTGGATSRAQELRSGRFIVQHVGVGEPYAKEVLDIAESAYATVVPALGHAPGGPITIMLTITREQFRHLTSGVMPDWSAAAALPGNIIVLGPVDVISMALDRVIAHELVHVIIDDAVHNVRVPRWFHEGCAETWSGQLDVRDRMFMAWQALRGGLMSFDEIDGVFRADLAHVGLAYDQSMLAVGMLIEMHGPGVVPAILDGMGRGDTFGQAFERATGVTVGDFEALYLDSLKRRYGRRALWTLIPSTWTVIMLLAIVVYIIKRRRNRRLMSQWDVVEAAENVIRFPGPKYRDDDDGDGVW